MANARDFSYADPNRYEKRSFKDMNALKELDLDVELVNLKDFFGRKGELLAVLRELGAIFVSGGNVFVLRQAMSLSGLDDILVTPDVDSDFLYAGYSAAGCVLAPSLKAYSIVDSPDAMYTEMDEVIWEGLGLVDFAFMPHWDSEHPESDGVAKEIAYCEEHDIPYRAVRDGDAVVIE